MAGNSSSGRRPKAQDLAIIERLSVLDDKAFELLEKGIDEGDFNCLKLFLNYRLGRPREQKEVTVMTDTNQQLPFNVVFKSSEEMARDKLLREQQKISNLNQ